MVLSGGASDCVLDVEDGMGYSHPLYLTVS